MSHNNPLLECLFVLRLVCHHETNLGALQLVLLLRMDRTGHTRVIIIFQLSGHIRGILKFNDEIKRCLPSEGGP